MTRELPYDKDRRQRSSFYRPELDVLRFFAFLAVFQLHSNQQPFDYYAAHFPLFLAKVIAGLIYGGKYGVSLFFTLSSYLITDLLLREKELFGTLDVRSFYLRRILRIWPLYYSFILLTKVVPFFDPHHIFGWRYVVPFCLLAGNWSFVAFGWPYATAIVPLWSVSIEEQFYLLWPPVVARLSRAHIIYAAFSMIAAANLVRVGCLLKGVTDESLWANTFAHLDTIAAGILLACLLRGKSPNLKVYSRVLIIITGIGAITTLLSSKAS
jgi:peptidoglycan/LPS O-acetylase OafA/YrhL